MNIHIIFAIITLFFLLFILFPIYRAKDIEKGSKVAFLLIISALFLSGVWLLYNKFGTPDIVPLMAEREQELAQLKQKIIANSELIKNDPKNMKAWIELGDSFMESNQFSAAANAYKQAVLLSQGNSKLIMSYVQALIIDSGGTVTEEAKKGLEMVRMLEPQNEQAQYFLIMHKVQSGNTGEAMEEMKKLYKSLPDDSPIKDAIDRQIGRK